MKYIYSCVCKGIYRYTVHILHTYKWVSLIKSLRFLRKGEIPSISHTLFNVYCQTSQCNLLQYHSIIIHKIWLYLGTTDTHIFSNWLWCFSKCMLTIFMREIAVSGLGPFRAISWVAAVTLISVIAIFYDRCFQILIKLIYNLRKMKEHKHFIIM